MSKRLAAAYSESLHCTPELRHAGRQLMGDTSARFRFVSDKQSSSRGSVGIPEGFPRPVGAVVNRSLVYHRFHQCRHFREPSWPARILPVLDIVTQSAAFAGCTPVPGTHRFDCVRLLDPDSRLRVPPPL